MRVARVLMMISAAVMLLLGSLHLLYTFHGDKLWPRDAALQVRMTEVSPIITQETTMWRTWVGFNASHSMGAILFGLIFGYLAAVHASLLFQSPYLLGVGLAMLAGYAVLGKLYWFSVPFTGICLALACFVVSALVARWS